MGVADAFGDTGFRAAALLHRPAIDDPARSPCAQRNQCVGRVAQGPAPLFGDGPKLSPR